MESGTRRISIPAKASLSFTNNPLSKKLIQSIEPIQIREAHCIYGGVNMWNEPTKERLDQIPRLYETEHVTLKDKQIYLHFFIAGCDWFVCEYDGQDIFFGFACLNGDLEMAEWGYISFQELKGVSINGIEIDCELPEFWNIRSAKEVDLIRRKYNWQVEPKQQIVGGEDGIHT